MVIFAQNRLNINKKNPLCSPFLSYFKKTTHLLHIIPVGDDSVLDGVLQSENTSLALGLVSYVGILLSHTDHDSLVARAANDRGEDGTWSIISSETGLAHTGSIVYNQRGYVLVAHFDRVLSNGV